MSNKFKPLSVFLIVILVVVILGAVILDLFLPYQKDIKEKKQVSIPENLKLCFETPALYGGRDYQSDSHGSASSVVDKTQSGDEIRSHSSGKLIEGPKGKMWVTVAHAVLDLRSGYVLDIVVGDETKSVSVDNSYCHKDYDGSNLNNDIAFIPIEGDPPFQEFKKSIRKVNEGDEVFVYASGFSGVSNDGAVIGQLRKAKFKVINITKHSIEIISVDDAEYPEAEICSGDSGSMVENEGGYNVGVIKSIIPRDEGQPPCNKRAFVQAITIGD